MLIVSVVIITALSFLHDLIIGPTPSSGSSTPVIQANNLTKQNASSATTTTINQNEQQKQQSAILANSSDGSHDVPAAVTKIPPKVAKKPKANKKPTQPQASTGNHSYCPLC